MLEEIPKDSTDKMPYYYWDGSTWQFDEAAYYKDQDEKAAQAAEVEKSRRKKQRLRYRRKISLMR